MGYLHLSYLTYKYIGTFPDIFLLLSFIYYHRGQRTEFECLKLFTAIEGQVWSIPETILYSFEKHIY